MLTHGIISLRYGSAAPRNLSDREQEFYGWLSATLVGTSSVLNSEQQNEAPTLALTHSELFANPGLAYGKLHDLVAGWIGDVDVIVLDLTYHQNSRPSRIDREVTIAAWAAVTAKATKPSKTFVILLGAVPDGQSEFGKVLTSIVASTVHVIALEDGLPAASLSPEQHLQLRRRHKAIGLEPIERFRQKLVAKRGHFLADDGRRCLQIIFDATDAEAELAALFEDELQSLDAKSTIVLFHSISSTWMDPAILASTAKLGVSAIKYVDHQSLVSLPSDCATILLVLPLVDSGVTVCRIVQEIRKQVSKVDCRVVAVLSTEGNQSNFGATKKTLQDGLELEIKYFLRVAAVRESSPCRQCKLHRQHQPRDFELDEIETFHFWDMAKNWRDEPDQERPENRANAGYLPNFSSVIEGNGAWLAQKFSRLMRKTLSFDPLVTPVVVVCPDEDGATLLAHYVGVLKGFTVVPIPRTDLKDLTEMACSDRALLMGKSWAKRIVAATPTAKFVLLEEFMISGSTRRQLIAALNLLGKSADAHLAIVDFGLRFSRSADNGVVSLSLYACPIRAEA